MSLGATFALSARKVRSPARCLSAAAARAGLFCSRAQRAPHSYGCQRAWRGAARGLVRPGLAAGPPNGWLERPPEPNASQTDPQKSPRPLAPSSCWVTGARCDASARPVRNRLRTGSRQAEGRAPRYARSSTTNAAHRLPRSPQADSCALATRRATRRTLPSALPAVMRRNCQPAAGCCHGNAAATLGRLLPTSPCGADRQYDLTDLCSWTRPSGLRASGPSLWAPAQRRGGGSVRRGWLGQVALHLRGAMVGLVLLYPFFRTTGR